MKIWIDRDGNVRSMAIGSIEEQNTDMMKILTYLQSRTAYMRKVADRADGKRQTAKEINEEAAENGMTD